MKKWAAQWKAAGPALEAVRVRELGELNEAKNAVIAASFFLEPKPPRKTSGLVEQQAIFLKYHRR